MTIIGGKKLFSLDLLNPRWKYLDF